MKILVVEDEPGVKAYTTATLTNSGYEVESASDGDEAFRLYRKRGPYDLVLTDRHHPGMDGLDLAAAIRQENPTQAIAFFTADVHSEPVGPFRRKFKDIPVLLKGAVQREATTCHWPPSLETDTLPSFDYRSIAVDAHVRCQ